jgi:tetratricopeptide (TPR) repeat protein
MTLGIPNHYRWVLAAVGMGAALAVTACERTSASEAASADAASAAPTDAAAAEDRGLATSGSEEEAGQIEEEVWGAWMFSGSPTVDMLMVRAQDAIEGDDLDRARDMYDRAILIKPDYSEAWYRRALLFFNDGKYDEAIADLEGALRGEPRHFGAWIGLGAIFESIERPEAALRAYRKALAVHPFAAAAKQGESRLVIAVEGRPL